MHFLKSEADLTELLAQENAALFLFVDWSEYAKRGHDIFKAAEAKLCEELPNKSVSWWTADTSSVNSCDPALHDWLRLQDRKWKAHMFPNIATGGGSLVWTKNGEVVGFEANAQLLSTEALLRRTAEVLR